MNGDLNLNECINDLEKENAELNVIGLSCIVVLIELSLLESDDVSYKDIEDIFFNRLGNTNGYYLSQRPRLFYYICAKFNDSENQISSESLINSITSKSVLRKMHVLITEKKTEVINTNSATNALKMLTIDDGCVAIIIATHDENVLQQTLVNETNDIPIFYWTKGGDNNISGNAVYERQHSVFHKNYEEVSYPYLQTSLAIIWAIFSAYVQPGSVYNYDVKIDILGFSFFSSSKLNALLMGIGLVVALSLRQTNFYKKRNSLFIINPKYFITKVEVNILVLIAIWILFYLVIALNFLFIFPYFVVYIFLIWWLLVLQSQYYLHTGYGYWKSASRFF